MIAKKIYQIKNLSTLLGISDQLHIKAGTDTVQVSIPGSFSSPPKRNIGDALNALLKVLKIEAFSKIEALKYHATLR